MKIKSKHANVQRNDLSGIRQGNYLSEYCSHVGSFGSICAACMGCRVIFWGIDDRWLQKTVQNTGGSHLSEGMLS